MERKEKFHITSELLNTINQHPDMQTQEGQDQIAKALEAAQHKMAFLFNTDPQNAFSKILKEIDTNIEEIQQNKDFNISCKKGCSACCHINVDIYTVEAKRIIQYCNENNISIDKNYLKKQLTLKPFQRRTSATHSACVFLKDGLCSIYPVRPIRCRKYMVVSDPEICEAKYYKKDKRNDGFTKVDKQTQPAVVFMFDVEILLSVVDPHLRTGQGPLAAVILKYL